MSQQAAWFDESQHRIMYAVSMRRKLPASRMFTIANNLKVFADRNPGEETCDGSQGDGGKSLNGIPSDESTEAYKRFCPQKNVTAYIMPNGDVRLRRVLHELYWRFDSSDPDVTPDNIVMMDGGRDGLQKYFQAVQYRIGHIGGAFIGSAAPWISYAHVLYINGFNLLCAPAAGKMDFQITPEGIDEALALAKITGEIPVGLILTSPDNPTGTYSSIQKIVRNVNHAYKRGLRYILIDLIYQMVTDTDVVPYDWRAFIYQMLEPEVRKCVTFLDGLTKSTGASSVRSGHTWSGDKTLAADMTAIATHTNMANQFGQALAYEVYRHENPAEHSWVKRITVPTSESRAIFKRGMTELGHTFVADQGYYGFVDVEPWVGKKIPVDMQFDHPETHARVTEIKDADDVGNYLALNYGLAIVPATAFNQPNCIRWSLAQDPKLIPPALIRFDNAFKNLT